jgi:hypothetical protein
MATIHIYKRTLQTRVRTAQLVQRQARGWTAQVRFQAVQDFSLSTVSGPALGNTRPPNQWVPGGSLPGSKAPGA